MPNKLDLHALVKSTRVKTATSKLDLPRLEFTPLCHASCRVDGFAEAAANATNSAVCPFICCKTHPGSLPAVQHTKGDNRS
jgi:hypothetical protein